MITENLTSEKTTGLYKPHHNELVFCSLPLSLIDFKVIRGSREACVECLS